MKIFFQMMTFLQTIIIFSSLALNTFQASSSPVHHTPGGIYRRNDPSDGAISRMLDKFDEYFFDLKHIRYSIPKESEDISVDLLRLDHHDDQLGMEQVADATSRLPPPPNPISKDITVNRLRLAHHADSIDLEPLSELQEFDPSFLNYLNNVLDHSDEESIKFSQNHKRRRISHEPKYNLLSLNPQNHQENALNHQPVDFEEITPSFWDDVENADDETIEYSQDRKRKKVASNPKKTEGLTPTAPHMSNDKNVITSEFLKTMEKQKTLRSMEKEIIEYFHGLFRNFIKWKIIPWGRLTKADFKNWPEGVPAKNPRNLYMYQKKHLHSFLHNIKLSYHFKQTYKHRLEINSGDKARSISRHLLNIIDQRVGGRKGKLKHLKPEDVINWPPLRPVNPFQLLAHEVNDIYKNLNSLDIREEFIQKQRSKHDILKKSNSTIGKKELRQHVRDLLNQISGGRNILAVPWDIISRDSFTWWPSDIQETNPTRLSTTELQKIIAQKHRIQLTEEFKSQYLKHLDSKVKH